MTLEEARLLLLATLAAGPGDLLDCYSEPIRGGDDRIYTVELLNEEGTRWFGLHSKSLSAAEPIVLVAELRRQFAPPPALPAPAA